MRPTGAAAVVVVILAGLLAACSGQGSHSAGAPSPSPTPSQPAVGFTVDRTTAGPISMSGGPTHGVSSQTFRLGHHYHLVYFWSCSDFHKGSQFEFDLVENSASAGGSDQLVSVGRYGKHQCGTDQTTGSDHTSDSDRSSYVNGKRVYPSSYDIQVSAKACHWSLEVLCDGRSLLTYTGRGFAVTYDPAKVSLSAAPVVKKSTSVIVGDGVLMYNERYTFALHSSTLRHSTLASAAQAIAGKFHRRARPISLDGIRGYETTVRQGGLEVDGYLLEAARYRYAMSIMARSDPRWSRGLEKLVRSVRFLPAPTGT
jgi:hypothetical protein